MIVVAGSSGRIGREVVRRLAERGAAVRALVRSRDAPVMAPAHEIERCRCDLADRGSLLAAFAGAERLFLVSRAEPRQARLQANAVQAAVESGVRHVTYVSGIHSSLSPDSTAQVGRQHWQVERLIEASGLRYTFLRPNYFMQNLLETAAPMVASLGILAAPMARARIAMVDVRDVADVAVEALLSEAHDGQAYDVTGPRAISHEGLAALLAEATGRAVAYLSLPQALVTRELRRRGYDTWEIEHINAMASLLRSGAGGFTSTAVQDVTGHPARTIEAFTTECAAHFDAKGSRSALRRIAPVAARALTRVGTETGRS
jgi:uncharacterized protein YbjT (DUF2867 family)